MTNFKSIEELLRMLSREKALLKDMFQNRKSISYSYEMAREMVDYKSDRLTFLIEHGVIRDNGDALELEEVYLQFFENVLDVNEDISTAGVSDSLDALDSAIGYYLAEESPKRKYGYIKDIKRILHNIATLTFRNVVDLKRNIDSTYKNEPSYKVKKLKLEKLDFKRKAVTELIFLTEDYINNKKQGFFAIAADAGLRQTINEVKIQLKEAHHNILDLERQIILYLNLIEYQNRLIEKLRIVKYLRDQMVLETQTDIRELLNGTNPVWMENRPKYTLKISLDKLRNTDEGLAALKSLSTKLQKGSTLKRRKADAISEGYLDAKPRIADSFNTLEIKNSFLASGTDLYAFISNYNFSAPVDREQKLVLFCQIASQFQSELNITDEYHCDLDIEYPIIFPAQT